ncbi:MAG TPA: methyltransferase domain-containing protein [Candidatus Limnocylindria bacterium]|nr:methyltransferase domain-containing protein [Candidatus Limnocylindria bacterium]
MHRLECAHAEIVPCGPVRSWTGLMTGDRPAHDRAGYYDALGGRPARDTLVQAADAFGREGDRPRHAVDFGCGDGRDSLELLRRGWAVTAIDLTAEGLDRLTRRAGPAATLVTIQAPIEDVEWPRSDLVAASHALPFCPRERFDGLWERFVASQPSGGRFAGHLLGPNISWTDVATTRAS